MSTYDGGSVEALWEACQTCVAERDAARADAERLAAAIREIQMCDQIGKTADAEAKTYCLTCHEETPCSGDDLRAALAAHDALTGDKQRSASTALLGDNG